jgi:hypothetical protein
MMDLQVAIFLLIFLSLSSLATIGICIVELRSCWRQYRFRIECLKLRKLNLTVENVEHLSNIANPDQLKQLEESEINIEPLEESRSHSQHLHHPIHQELLSYVPSLHQLHHQQSSSHHQQQQQQYDDIRLDSAPRRGQHERHDQRHEFHRGVPPDQVQMTFSNPGGQQRGQHQQHRDHHCRDDHDFNNSHMIYASHHRMPGEIGAFV